MTDPMLDALNAATESLGTACHEAGNAPRDPVALYNRVGALVELLWKAQHTIGLLYKEAAELAERPPIGFRADDGSDPRALAHEAAEHLQTARAHVAAANVDAAHNALSHLGTG